MVDQGQRVGVTTGQRDGLLDPGSVVGTGPGEHCRRGVRRVVLQRRSGPVVGDRVRAHHSIPEGQRVPRAGGSAERLTR